MTNFNWICTGGENQTAYAIIVRYSDIGTKNDTRNGMSRMACHNVSPPFASTQLRDCDCHSRKMEHIGWRKSKHTKYIESGKSKALRRLEALGNRAKDITPHTIACLEEIADSPGPLLLRRTLELLLCQRVRQNLETRWRTHWLFEGRGCHRELNWAKLICQTSLIGHYLEAVSRNTITHSSQFPIYLPVPSNMACGVGVWFWPQT